MPRFGVPSLLGLTGASPVPIGGDEIVAARCEDSGWGGDMAAGMLGVKVEMPST